MGLEQRIFLQNGPFASERVQVLKFWFCPPGPLVPGWGTEGDFGSGPAGDQSSVLCACFGGIPRGFGVLTLKGSSVSC